MEKLDELSKMMPGKGRKALAFMPEPVKKKAREIAEDILNQPKFNIEYEKYTNAVKDQTHIYTRNPDKVNSAIEKAKADLIDRTAQNIIKGAAHLRLNNVFQINNEKINIAVRALEKAKGSPNITQEQVKVINKLAYKMKHYEFSQDEILQKIRSWCKDKNLNIDEKTAEKIVIENYKEKDPSISLDVDKQIDEKKEKLRSKYPDKEEIEIKKIASYIVKKDIQKDAYEKSSIMKGLGYSQDEIKKAVKEISPYDEINSKVLNKVETLENDTYEDMRKILKITSEQQKTVYSFAKVLTASNIEKEEAVRVINSWAERSGCSINKEAIEKAVDKADNLKKDLLNHGNELVVTKNEWEHLFKNLGYNKKNTPDWAWEFKNSSYSIVNTLWKSTFRSLEVEQTKAEYERQLMLQKAAKKQKEAMKNIDLQQREREDDLEK